MSYKSLIGILISLLLIIALIFSVKWSDVWVEMGRMSLWPLLPALALVIAQYWARALRWRLLLPGETKIKSKALFDAIMVGSLANFVLPLRAGEFIRPFLLTRYTSISFSTSLVSVIVERFFDLALVLGLFGIMAYLIPELPTEVIIGATGLSSLAICILIIMVLGSFMEKQLLSVVDYFTDRLPSKLKLPIRKFSKDFLHGASVLKTPTRVVNVILMTVLVWALILGLNWISFWLFEIAPSANAVLALTVIIALSVAAPSAPGFIGVYQWACVAAFALFDYPNEKAVAFSIITHIFNFVLFIILGGLILWRDGVSLSDLKPKKPE